jgi:hypothetical protein
MAGGMSGVAVIATVASGGKRHAAKPLAAKPARF